MNVITTRSLAKRFGTTLAVDGIDLEVRDGDRYGFLGPNGSGKTTTVRLLLGLVYPTSGEISVLGQPIPKRVSQVLPDVGALVEGPAAYRHLSASANLALLDAAGPHAGRLRRSRAQRIAEALDQVGLAGVGRRPVGQYSLGMKQRLSLAAALVRRPRLLVLDEPTNGLDPRGIRDIRDLLAGLNAQGTTIFLSSHLLAEVELLCDRVGVLDRGRLVLQESLAAIQADTGRVVVRVSDPAAAVRALDGRVVGRDDDRLTVTDLTGAELTDLLVSHQIRVHELVPLRRTLEDVVMELTGPGSDDVPGSRKAPW